MKGHSKVSKSPHKGRPKTTCQTHSFLSMLIQLPWTNWLMLSQWVLVVKTFSCGSAMFGRARRASLLAAIFFATETSRWHSFQRELCCQKSFFVHCECLNSMVDIQVHLCCSWLDLQCEAIFGTKRHTTWSSCNWCGDGCSWTCSECLCRGGQCQKSANGFDNVDAV